MSTENHSWSFENVLFVYIFSVLRHTQQYAEKLDGLLVNENEIVTKFFAYFVKLQRAQAT